MASVERLSIWMNGERVGTWSRQRAEHELAYDPQWIVSPQGRPLSLSLPIVPGNVPHRGHVVRSFFENLLPDRPEVRNRLRDRFRAPSADAFDLLAEIGRDCVGAVQLLRPDEVPPTVRTIEGVPLSDDTVARQLEMAAGVRLAGFDSEVFRISLAGAQEKTAFLRHEGAWHSPIGTTPTTHIFKLAIGGIKGTDGLGSHSIENEWLCSRIVAAYGLPVARTEIARFGGYQVLVVERFDRRLTSDSAWWMRLPVEDLCQAKGLPPEKKYEADGGPGIDAVMRVLAGSERPAADRENFLKACILFWILGASDGHAKNFSLLLGPVGSYRLAPLYDVLSVYPWLGRTGELLPVQKLKMAMAVRGKNTHYHWSSIQRRHWIQTAGRNGLGRRVDALISELIDRTPAVVQSVRAELPLGFPSRVADAVFEGMTSAASRLAR